MKLQLIQDGGPFKDEIVIDHFPFVLGRHMACDHQLYHPMVSRRHCRFEQEGDRVIVADLASSNGTYLNGRPIRQTASLCDGDQISLACVSYRVSVSDN